MKIGGAAMTIRTEITEALKKAMKEGDKETVATCHLIQAALKDKDIEARGLQKDPLGNTEILWLFQSMIKSRRESIDLYEKGGRPDLVAREQAEIRIIERFMPAQMTDEEIDAAVDSTIRQKEARSLKDMGALMAFLKQTHGTQMDMSKAGDFLKKKLQGLGSAG